MKNFILFLFVALTTHVVAQEVPESLLREAYERMQYDIRASHILIKVDKNAYPEDTLAAYKKVMTIRDRALKGEAFEIVAKEASEDPSSRDHEDAKTKNIVIGNGGDLGYFTVLNMNYPFETGAYNTPMGQVSIPIRTDFGYHLIKVTDRKPALGKTTVAHIFVNVPVEAKSEDMQKYKDKINEVYSKLKTGGKWEDLVTQYSDDKSSAEKAGQLPAFGVNRMVPEFIFPIYNLKDLNDISEPIHTKYGWHIIKLIERIPIGSYEEEKKSLNKRILNDSRYNENYAITKTEKEQLKDNVNHVLPITDTFKDPRDSKIYKTVKIGTQTWMAENLAYKASSGCGAYFNIQSYVQTYGYLYNYETAKNACPTGWHLPCEEEWTTLSSYLGGEDVAGGKLKETDTIHWKSPNSGATNESGFTALPGGFSESSLVSLFMGTDAIWWSKSDENSVFKNLRSIYYKSEKLGKSSSGIKNAGYSVRCLKDE